MSTKATLMKLIFLFDRKRVHEISFFCEIIIITRINIFFLEAGKEKERNKKTIIILTYFLRSIAKIN